MLNQEITQDKLIAEYYDAILAHCNYKLKFDTIAAHEITQETFYQLLLHWDRFRTRTEPGLVTWLYKTSDLLIKKHFRIQKQEEKVISMDEIDDSMLCDEDFQIDHDIIIQEERSQYTLYIDTIKKNLTEKERLIFEYIIEENHSVLQAAQALNMKKNTVMISLYRVRKKAKKIINTNFPKIVKNSKGGKK